MFTQIKNEQNLNRYGAELHDFYVMVQLAENKSRQGIADGRITRLLVYPSNNSSAKGRVVIFDRGWGDQVPDQEDIRKVIEETVHHFDETSVNWDHEAHNRSASAAMVR